MRTNLLSVMPPQDRWRVIHSLAGNKRKTINKLSEDEAAEKRARAASLKLYQQYLETLPKPQAAKFRQTNYAIEVQLRFLEKTFLLIERRDRLQDLVRDVLKRFRRQPVFAIENIGTKKAAVFCALSSGVRVAELAVVMGVSQPYVKVIQTYLRQAERDGTLNDHFAPPEFVVSRSDVVEAGREMLEKANATENLILITRNLELIGRALGLLTPPCDRQPETCSSTATRR